jgi:hypothetical protein
VTYDDRKTTDDTPEPDPNRCEHCGHPEGYCACHCCNEPANTLECPSCGSVDPCLRGFSLDGSACADVWHDEIPCGA